MPKPIHLVIVNEKYTIKNKIVKINSQVNRNRVVFKKSLSMFSIFSCHHAYTSIKKGITTLSFNMSLNILVIINTLLCIVSMSFRDDILEMM